MGKKDPCAVFWCNNERLFREKYAVKYHISNTKLQKRWSLLHPNTAQSYPKKTLRKNVKKSARKYRQTKCMPPYRWKGLLLRIDSKWEGFAFELPLSGKLVVNSKRRIKAWSEATEAIYRVGFGNEGSSLIPNSRSFFHENPASRT